MTVKEINYEIMKVIIFKRKSKRLVPEISITGMLHAISLLMA